MKTYNENFDSIDAFLLFLKAKRKENKNNWYAYFGSVNDQKIELKIYDTWLQLFNINGINISTPMEMSVKTFFETIKTNLNK